MKRILLALFILAACTPPRQPGATEKERFDNWQNAAGVQVVHAPVPCQRVTYLVCGALGGYEIAAKTVYLHDAVIAAEQAQSPGIDVALHVLYHERAHAAFFIINAHLNPDPQNPGTAQVWFEREAQCGMRLLVGGWKPLRGDPDIYWVCPDAKVAETRWVWASHGVI